jgi:hypothetical protein
VVPLNSVHRNSQDERLLEALGAGDSPRRIRLTQALAEMPATIAQSVLNDLAHDDNRAVAVLASTLLGSDPAAG